MRIALVITELDPGGAEKCMTQLACFLSKQGHEVRVFAIGPPPIAGQDAFLKELESHQVTVDFGIASGSRSIRSFPKVVHWLRRELQRFAPEVVQAMLFHANLLAALATDYKHVKLFGGVRVRQPERWRWWLQRWASRRMLKVICVSEDVATHCEKYERIASDRLVSIPNGIDLHAVNTKLNAASEFTWSRYGLPKHASVLLFVGRLHSQKGVEELVARADQLLAGLPEHHLAVIGNGPLENRLKELAGDRVHILGWQSNPILFMSQAEVLLLPACYEGMPNVLLEAMAVRLPFIAFDVDGVRQLLGDSPFATYQIAASGNFEQFFSLTQQMTGAPALRANCAQSNFERITHHFLLADKLAAYAELYQTCRLPAQKHFGD